MKTVITIEDGIIEISVDGGSPVIVQPDPSSVVVLDPKPASPKPKFKPEPIPKITHTRVSPREASKNEALQVEVMMDEHRSEFDDRWDCGVCRNAGSLCVLHEKLEADGKKPFTFRNVGGDKG